jgi:hypothetical protein
MARGATSLDQNYIVTPRVWLGTLPVIVQPVFEFRHPLFKTIKASPYITPNTSQTLSRKIPRYGAEMMMMLSSSGQFACLSTSPPSSLR